MEASVVVKIIIIVVVLGLVVYSHKKEKQNRETYQARQKEKQAQQKEKEEALQKRNHENKELYDNFISRYGECTTSVSWKGWKEWSEINMEKLVLVFDEYEIIVIKSKEYKF